MGSLHEAGRAAIMGIGTALPPNVVPQASFPDYYFSITNSDHMVDLKAKFTKICEKTMIEKRHFSMSDEFLRSNPSITAYKSPSLDIRQEAAEESVAKLGAEAARVAIRDWGGHASDITHLVLCTTVSGCIPGADLELTNLLGLPLSTKRFMLYQVGCHGGAMALRLAKDLAENNPSGRVLVVCSEVITMAFRGPSESHLENLVGQALFGDGAGAVIVGAGRPRPPVGGGGGGRDGLERPIFEMMWASQDVIPETKEMVVVKLREEGIVYSLHRDMPMHISNNIRWLTKKALAHANVNKDWKNEEVFWLVHPGGRAILDKVESALGLGKKKLDVCREVMRQHGNTLSTCVIMAMDEMRRESEKNGVATAGEGLEWGLLFGFGPGVTVETILLRAPRNPGPARSAPLHPINAC